MCMFGVIQKDEKFKKEFRYKYVGTFKKYFGRYVIAQKLKIILKEFGIYAPLKIVLFELPLCNASSKNIFNLNVSVFFFCFFNIFPRTG